MNVSTNPPIRRITCLTLDNFRGFVGHHELNTDADLILITGPNGYGKTSLLEALTLILTGWHWPDDFKSGKNIERLVSLNHHEKEKVSGFKLVADVLSDADPSSGGPVTSIELSSLNGSLPLPTWVRSSGTKEDGVTRYPLLRARDLYQNRELMARLTAFFQDHIENLFDEVAEGNTLRDIYEPSLPEIQQLANESGDDDLLQKASDMFQSQLSELKIGPDQEIDSIVEKLANAYQSLRRVYIQWPQRPRQWPDADSTPEAIQDDKALDEWARRVLKAARYPESKDQDALRYELRESVNNEIRSQIDLVKKKPRAQIKHVEIQSELDKIEQEIAEIDKRYPKLEYEVGYLVSSKTDQPDVPSIFRALADNAERWSHFKVPAGVMPGLDVDHFERAMEDLANVVPGQAMQYAQAIEQWLGPRRQASSRREWLIKEQKRLQQDLNDQAMSAELERLIKHQRDWNLALTALEEPWRSAQRYREWESRSEHRTKAIDLLNSADSAVRWYKGQILSIASSGRKCDLMCDVQKLANAVLRRFSLVDGILPLSLVAVEGGRRSYQVKASNGRTLSQLSTGQRAQIAVAFLTSQNLAVGHFLTHSILLLDDVTTAYDLSNLTREAILWRQLAYGAEDDGHRRQIFISSHHEDMTNHLIDLMVPPGGKRMHLIRFTDWCPDKGPVYEIFNVLPTRQAGKKSQPVPGRMELATDLASV